MAQTAEETLDQLPPRLTIERDPVDHVAPSANLQSLRDSGKLEKFDFIDPLAGGEEPVEAWAITKYEEAKEFLSNPSTRLGVLAESEKMDASLAVPGFILFLEGEEHRRVKTVLVRHLNAKRVRDLIPELERIVDGLLDQLDSNGNNAELIEALTSKVPALTVSYLMGIPYEDAHMIEKWTRTQSDQTISAEEAKDAVVNLHRYTTALVERVRETPGEDLISALVHDHTDTLSDLEVVGLALNILSAALDTTMRFSTLVILTLLRNAEQRAIMVEDGGLSDSAIDELLRYLSPAPSAQWRYTMEDMTVGEHSLKAGERVSVSLLAANWDPEFIGDHPELNLRRRRAPHIAFAYGMHQCPGQHLARLEIEVMVNRLFARFPDLRLANHEQELNWLTNDLIYSIDRLHVEW